MLHRSIPGHTSSGRSPESGLSPRSTVQGVSSVHQANQRRVERRRALFRTVTSDVSAVSSFVANSRQSMQHGSSSLSKTPYVGFSPIRLQTGIQPRLSPVSAGLSTRSAFTRPTPTYTWLKLLVQRGVSPQRCWFSHSQALSSSGAPFTLANNTPIQRPLAHQRVGSLMGYAVPSSHRLLRPHPKLSTLPSIYLLP